MDPKRLEEFRSLLLREKEELEHQLEVSDRFDLNTPQQEYELSSYDNHPADSGTETYERGKDIALLENARTYLSDIEQAIKRMEEGTYGICLQCGRPIPEERLEVLPTARYCMEHQRQHEDRNRDGSERPAEEEALYPPFGRTSLDEREDFSGFDGEDAWQLVEQYGSSDTPDTYGGKESYHNLFVERDEMEGFAEPLESFVATDLDGGAGEDYDIFRNERYESYLKNREGDPGNAVGEEGQA